MARPLRLEFPGAVYHITARGNGRNDIFVDDQDRQQFIAILSETVERYNWLCHAYCLMDNHYHLLIETPDPTLSKGMRQLNGVYTQAFNRSHNRIGHVFQGRFKSIIVEKDDHLLQLCRYIVLNPVRADMVKMVEQWIWSSYNSTAWKNKMPELLTIDWVLGQFSESIMKARKQYRVYVIDGMGSKSPWHDLKGQIFYGGERFIGRMQKLIGRKGKVREIPREQRVPHRPALHEILDTGMTKKRRNNNILSAHLQYGYSLIDIGEHLGIHYSTVSRVVKKG